MRAHFRAPANRGVGELLNKLALSPFRGIFLFEGMLDEPLYFAFFSLVVCRAVIEQSFEQKVLMDGGKGQLKPAQVPNRAPVNHP